ncbi:MAG: 2-oxoacid:acceptor oxidoreductase family protein [Fusobacteriaceae bacterium]
MDNFIICSGFGGQGVMSMGQILAYSGMIENKEVSWLPSYGPEMRGGTANCSVILSDEPIGSPVITNNATALIAMNLPSLKKFQDSLVENGVLLVNSSLVKEDSDREDIKIYKIPANDLAHEECSNLKVANMIMLGAYLEISEGLKNESVLQGFLKIFGERKADLLPINEKALRVGRDYIKNNY